MLQHIGHDKAFDTMNEFFMEAMTIVKRDVRSLCRPPPPPPPPSSACHNSFCLSSFAFESSEGP